MCEVHMKSAGFRESAGGGEWRKEASDRGPSISALLGSSLVYLGRLHLYNVDTEKTYTITTNHGDSEVLLVEDSIVYFRASNRLYSAPIGETSIGAATLLATDEVIRDAHWAFIKH